MRRPFGARRALAAAAVAPLCLVEAWGPDGHERIGRVAQALLAGKHRDQIRTMMHSDVIDISNWESEMLQKYPATSVLHWHKQDPEWSCGSRGGLGDKGHIRCDGHGAKGGSLFCALAYFFEHFAHDALLKEYPTPKEPIETPKALAALEGIPSSELKSSQYLRWLIMLVADLHQPLHWLAEHSYGKDIEVVYKGEKVDLLTFWETKIPKSMKPLKNTLHPDKSDKDYGRFLPAWEHKNPAELFREWAKDAAEKLCTEVYAPMTVNHQDGTRVESPFVVTDELFEKWLKLGEDLIDLGGERLAFVLNDIIEHKRHKEAHADGRGLPSVKMAVGTETVAAPTKKTAAKGKTKVQSFPVSADDIVDNTVVSDLDDSDEGPDSDGSISDEEMQEFRRTLKILERGRSRNDGLKNAGVAVVVVPALLLILTWHQRLGGGSLWRMKQHLKM